MTSQTGIAYSLAGGVAIVTINRPDRLNALNHGTATELSAALDRACVEKARALVLTGAGRFFSSGGDLTTDLDLGDIGEPMERIWNPLSEQLMDLPMPVIAAMNGPAVGISCAFALLADFIIADPDAYFLFSFASLGLIPDGGGTWLLTRSVGRHRAMVLIGLAECLSAAEAKDWGLVYKLAAKGGALAEAQSLASRLAKGPTKAYDLIRKSMRAALEGNFTESLHAERVLQTEAGQSRDFVESLKAFAEKRPAIYVGA